MNFLYSFLRQAKLNNYTNTATEAVLSKEDMGDARIGKCEDKVITLSGNRVLVTERDESMILDE